MRKQVKDLTAAEFKTWLKRNGACNKGMRSVKRLLVFNLTPKQAWDRCSDVCHLHWAIWKLFPAWDEDYATCDQLRTYVPFPGDVYVEI